jgi:lipopolysaccharide heptosyltransferase I
MPQPLNSLTPNRVCLIKPSALGDIVQALPVLAGLRRLWPSAHIAWVVNAGFAGILEGCPGLDEIIPFPRRAGPFSLASLAWNLLRGGFDLTIDLQGLFRSAALAWLTRAPRRVGFATAREWATLAYTDTVNVNWRGMSAVLANWSIAQALGCQGPPPPARLGLTASHRADVQRLLGELPRPLIAIHAGASWQTKRWPAEHFAALASRALASFGGGVVIVGGPGEEAIGKAIASSIVGPVLDITGKTALLQLAAILEAADVMLSNDSGPMHLAAALGTRVVSPFTCTSPLRAGPFGPVHRAVPTEVVCAGSYLRRCPSMVCMQELMPRRLWPALIEALQRGRAA